MFDAVEVIHKQNQNPPQEQEPEQEPEQEYTCLSIVQQRSLL